MLLAEKVNIHGMEDKRWIIRDKISQYRGVNDLCEHDRRTFFNDLSKKKIHYRTNLLRIRNEIDAKRNELNLVVKGDKQFLRNVLQDHRRLQLAYANSEPDRVLEIINQENFNKRKQLDRMECIKREKLQKFRTIQVFLVLRFILTLLSIEKFIFILNTNTQANGICNYAKRGLRSDGLQVAEVQDRILFDECKQLPTEMQEHSINNFLLNVNAKKSAALALRTMYLKIYDTLKKDSIYFQSVLNALDDDCSAQSKCLRGATEVSQLCMEYKDDRYYEYVRMENEMRKNMKERASTLKNMRKKLRLLIDSLPRLVMGHEDIRYEQFQQNFLNSKKLKKPTTLGDLNPLDSDISLESGEQSIYSELEDAQASCKQLQRDVLVSSLNQVIPRLKEQDYLQTRHEYWLRIARIKQDSATKNLENGTIVLSRARNVGQQETLKYLKEQAKLKKEIAEEKIKQKKLLKETQVTRNLMLGMRTGLENTLFFLRDVGVKKQPSKGKKTVSFLSTSEVNVKTFNVDGPIQKVPNEERDWDKMISTSKQKLELLVNSVSQVTITPQLCEKSRKFYEGIIIRKQRAFYKQSIVDEESLIDFEYFDPNVLDHKTVKLMSKQLVDAQVSEFDVPHFP